jgi:uncharacterized membrane protein YjfL (UPF0719 family)
MYLVVISLSFLQTTSYSAFTYILWGDISILVRFFFYNIHQIGLYTDVTNLEEKYQRGNVPFSLIPIWGICNINVPFCVYVCVSLVIFILNYFLA